MFVTNGGVFVQVKIPHSEFENFAFFPLKEVPIKKIGREPYFCRRLIIWAPFS
jgi:hypothetical protein